MKSGGGGSLGMRPAAMVLCSLALTLIPSCRQPCDASRINREGAALVDEIDAWSPRDGHVPDFSTVAAGVVWSGCDTRMPSGFRGYLDFTVPHPRPPWELDGGIRPEGVEWNPVEESLPGHRGVHGGPRNGEDPQVMTWLERVCPDVTDVVRRALAAPAETRGAVIQEGCGLQATRWLDREPHIGVNLLPLDLVGVALRDYLVDAGVRATVADRLLFELVVVAHKPLERPLLGPPLDTQAMALPWATGGVPLDNVPKNVVYADGVSVRVGDTLVAKRSDSAKLTELVPEEEQLLGWRLVDREHGEDVLLVADRDTAWSLVVDIAEATHAAGDRGVRVQEVRCAVLRDDRVNRVQALSLPRITRLGPDATLQEVLLELMEHRDGQPKVRADPDKQPPSTGLFAPKPEVRLPSATGGGHGSDATASPSPANEPALRIRMAKTTVEGALDKQVLRGTFRAHLDEIRQCYEKGLTKNPQLKGRVSIEFVIGGAGEVTTSRVAATTVDDNAVGLCMANSTKRWTFPKSSDGADVTVGLPIVLAPG